LVSIVLARASPSNETMLDATLTPNEAAAPARLRAALAPHALRVEALADGSVLAVVSAAGAATDQAARAARGAPAMQPAVPEDAAATRQLLGKPTQCVGRERELATLDAIWRDAVGEPAAHAVLVIGPPGQGKSRLRQEIVLRLGRRDQAFTMLLGRGDPMRK